MTNLSINLNKIALLRNQRDIGYPDPVAAGNRVLQAGANGLTVHPRPDQRHIRTQDVAGIAAMIHDQGWSKRGVEFNIEGFPSDDFIKLVLAVKPDQVTLVPDAPDAKTSDHGWRLEQPAPFLAAAMGELRAANIRISMFLDAESDAQIMQAQLDAAKALGADAVELYTEPYAMNYDGGECKGALAQFSRAAKLADRLGLRVNAGHDLNLENLGYFKQHISPLAEVSIGHAFTADALWMGFDRAISAYKAALGDIA
ncbi:MAG: pyridoxine 5'-phosphate synthase [Alphaproteobacteria bacterium]